MSKRWPADVVYDADEDYGVIQYKDMASDRPEGYGFHFQHGPTGDKGENRNGLMNEELIELLVVRLRALNERFPCRENSIAITKLQEAGFWLEHRMALRIEQGVYGKNEPHTG